MDRRLVRPRRVRGDPRNQLGRRGRQVRPQVGPLAPGQARASSDGRGIALVEPEYRSAGHADDDVIAFNLEAPHDSANAGSSLELSVVAKLYRRERREYARNWWISPSTSTSSRAALPS